MAQQILTPYYLSDFICYHSPFSLTLLQSMWAHSCSSSMAGTLVQKDLWSSYSLCLEHSSLRHPFGQLPQQAKSFPKFHPLSEVYSDLSDTTLPPCSTYLLIY